MVIDYIQSAAGQSFLSRCANLSIAVEYELHAMGELLSRELFYKDPTFFRMDENKYRNPDYNCNPFNPTALEIIAEKAERYAKIPTSPRSKLSHHASPFSFLVIICHPGPAHRFRGSCYGAL